ncbi:hypothetical protein HYV31_01775 [candidate division WWE3 bacterium]|nr:hypothetical protein [candidate division WWE3 bacterium]
MIYGLEINARGKNNLSLNKMLEKPYLKKLEKVDDFQVYEVDGRFIRDNINREFTNFGQHFRFPFIPKYEFWIDKEYDPGEERFFVVHLLREWHLMSLGSSYDDAIGKADYIEKKERAKSNLFKKAKTEKVEKHQIPKEIYVKKLLEYSKGIDVWVVNGEVVRDVYFIDFTEGGHHFIYSWVPRNEVWIDDDLSDAERPFVILHELHERFLMSAGLDYSKAHLSSSIIEYKCRREPKKTFDYISRETKKNQNL